MDKNNTKVVKQQTTKNKNVVNNKNVVKQQTTNVASVDFSKLTKQQQQRVYQNKLLINLTKLDKTLKREYNLLINTIAQNNKINNTNNINIKFDIDELNAIISMMNNLYSSLSITFDKTSYNALKIAFLASINGRAKVQNRGVKVANNDYGVTLSPFVLALQQRRFGILVKPLD